MTATIQRPANHTTPNSLVIRALSSITPQQARTIEQAVQASRHAWDVITIDDYDGYLCILLQPSVSTDSQKAFFVSGTAHRLELSETTGDELTTLATFTSAEGLASQLRNSIP
jgi:hypothetical protein